MRRLLPALLLLLLPSLAQALSLSRDTLWEGDLRFAGTVRVEPGVTLTVRPGTTVTFVSGRLEVAGRLLAGRARFTGRGWEGIVLKGCDAATVIEESTVEGAAVGVFVGGGEPRLVGLTLAGNGVGVELKQKTSAEVVRCLFKDSAKVGLFVKDGSAPSVRDNRFEGSGRFGVYIHRARPVDFRGNTFTDNPTALAISYFGSDPVVEGNLFEENELAVLVDRAAKPVIAGNRIRRNGTGIRLYRRSDPVVENNLIANNDIGISVAFSSYPRISGNDLVDNGTALLLEFQSSRWEQEEGAAARAAEIAGRGAFGQGVRGSVSEEDRRARTLDGTVDARGNWWGEAGAEELTRLGADGNPSFIADGRDTPAFVEKGKSYPLDKVRFAPWSTKPLTVVRPGGEPGVRSESKP